MDDRESQVIGERGKCRDSVHSNTAMYLLNLKTKDATAQFELLKQRAKQAIKEK